MLKKVIENIIFVILLVILGISVSPALPFKNIPRTYMVISGSMEPTIKTGSVVLTKPVDPKQIKVGDIVAFTSPSKSSDVILHRVSAIKSESPLRFQTKGDNNNTPDAWDLMDVGILGKQVFAVPYLGYVASFVRTPLGFGLIIVFPALLFIISQILNIKKYIKDEIDKQVKSKTLPLLFFFLSLFGTTSLFFTTTALASLSSAATISGGSFSVKDFVPPPAPVLLSPANNSTRTTDGMVMDWTDVSDYNNQHNPVYYIYESSHVSDFSTLAYQSGHLSDSNIPAPGTPNGVYYWHVKACDTLDNCSPWSTTWKVTVDSSYVPDTTPPESTIGTLPYNANSSPLTISYTATDNDAVDHTDLCYSFNNPLGPFTCGNYFNFNFPAGDGTYYFYTQATDQSGNVEAAHPNISDAVIYDTTPPTTNLMLSSDTTLFTGQNLLDSTLPAGPQMILGNQSIFRDFYLPQNYSGNLEFSYRFQSNDVAANDNFNVGIYFQDGIQLIKNILNDGNTTISPSYDTGWQNITHSLADLADRVLRVVFTVNDTGSGVGYDSFAEIDNLKVSSLDIRTGDTTPPNFLATDLGTGVIDSTTLPEIITSTDLAGNIEASHSASIVTLPPIVLNKITNSIVTLYNNTNSNLDLSTYSLDTGTTMSLSGTINSFGTVDITIPVTATTVSLLNNSSVVDTTTFETLGGATWTRQSDGLGPWVLINAPVSFDLQSRLSQSKITFTVSGLGSTLNNMDYAITYFGNGQDQQIAGTINPNTIDANGTVSRDFYLGTCSSGACTPATGIGTSFVVNFSDLPPKTFIFN